MSFVYDRGPGDERGKSHLLGGTDLDATGNALANIITGNTGANKLLGGGANDTLQGDAGEDTLQGDVGDDSMAGGAGNDRYIVDVNTAIRSSRPAAAAPIPSNP